jgi:hypothetical protein
MYHDGLAYVTLRWPRAEAAGVDTLSYIVDVGEMWEQERV